MNPGEDPLSSPDSIGLNGDAEVILTCLKRRFSGVSATIDALLPFQARLRPIAFVGAAVPSLAGVQSGSPHFRRVRLGEAISISRRRLPDGRRRIWHVRRDPEMILGIFVRDVLRCPIRLVFTSAAIRQHSIVPRNLIQQMDAVIATSPKAASFFQNTVAIVGHGVDVTAFQPPGDRQKAWLESGLPGRRAIGIFGRVRKEKGTHLFVRAAMPVLQQFPDVTAVIGGLCKPVDQPFAQELKRQIASAGLGDRFVWTGPIPRSDMAAWYRRTSVVVACPTYEGYGLTPLEAMASGCAVVATRTGAFESMVEDGATGFLTATDNEGQIGQALATLLADAPRSEAMGRRGRRRAVDFFSVENEARAINAVYEEVWRADALGKVPAPMSNWPAGPRFAVADACERTLR